MVSARKIRDRKNYPVVHTRFKEGRTLPFTSRQRRIVNAWQTTDLLRHVLLCTLVQCTGRFWFSL
jgi:hypothetical protein